MNIRKNIHKNLMKKGITAYKLSKDTKISQGYIYDILNGKESNPSIRIMKKIADYLGVTIDELVN